MKKVISMILSAVMLLGLLAGCGSEKKEGGHKVAIVQQLDHRSMNEIRDAAKAVLDKEGGDLTVEVFNGQNDPTILGQIGAQLLSDGFDAVLPIGTLAAQTVISATEGAELPVVYAAISDPEEAGVTGLPLVTGTSDALNTGLIVDMMLKMDPELGTVGLLYSNSEPNSKRPVAEIKELLAGKGIEVLEKTGHTADEVLSAAGALVGRVDAVFTPTDNAVMNVAPAVGELFAENGIPYYTGADSFVEEGAFASCGVNYQELGEKTAHMLLDLLNTGACPEFATLDGGVILYNDPVAAALGLDGSALAELTGTVHRLD